MTFIAVLAEVSMKSKLLSSAYACASYRNKHTNTEIGKLTAYINIFKSFIKEFLELQCQTVKINLYLEIYSSLVGQICFVSCQCNNNIRAGLSLELLHPVLCTCECILSKRKKEIKYSYICGAFKLLNLDRGFTCYISL